MLSRSMQHGGASIEEANDSTRTSNERGVGACPVHPFRMDWYPNMPGFGPQLQGSRLHRPARECVRTPWSSHADVGPMRVVLGDVWHVGIQLTPVRFRRLLDEAPPTAPQSTALHRSSAFGVSC